MDSLQASLPANQAKIRALLEQCKDPVWFSANILKPELPPWGKQIDVMQSVRVNKYTAVKSGHGVGKTWTAAHTALWFLTAFRPSRVITTAPTWQQVEKLLWAEINTQHARSAVPLGGTMLQTQLKIDDEHFAIGYSTDEATKFQGHHSEHVLVIFDEAMGVRPDIWEAAEGLLTNEFVRFLAIGNPTAPSGPFYNCFKSPLWNKITISCLDCPNVKEDRIIYPRLVTKAWVEERRQEWGENSSQFKSRVLGEFPTEGEDTLIPLTWIEQAIDRYIASTGQDKRVLGVDVARYGDDSTVFQGLDGRRHIHESAHQGKNTTRTVGEIMRLVKEQRYKIIAVDDSGVGGGVTDQLQDGRLEELTEYGRREGWLTSEEKVILIPVNFGAKAMDAERFENLKAEIFWNLRLDFEQGVIGLQKSDNLLLELPSLLYEVTSKGKLKIVGKDEMKRLGLQSPDYADALVIAHYATYAGRAGILDFYKSETEHNVTTPESILSQVVAGTSLETAFSNLTRRDS